MSHVSNLISRSHSTVFLGLGNDILGDDGVGIAAVRALRERLGDVADFVESGEAGLALLDHLAGYERAVILDSTVSDIHPPGTILEYSPDDFDKVIAPSPHYAGLPEVLAVARQMAIPFPSEIRILTMVVADPYTIQEGFSEEVKQAFEGFVERGEILKSEFL